MSEAHFHDMSEAHEKKLRKVMVKLTRGCTAKLKELRAKYGIKRIVHDCDEPKPSTDLHLQTIQEDNEFWFATYSEKSIPDEVHTLLSNLHSVVEWSKDDPEELLDMMAGMAGEMDWIIDTGFVSREDLVDDEEASMDGRAKSVALPMLEDIKKRLEQLDTGIRPRVRNIIKNQL